MTSAPPGASVAAVADRGRAVIVAIAEKGAHAKTAVSDRGYRGRLRALLLHALRAG